MKSVIRLVLVSYIVLFGMFLTFAGCTEQGRAKKFGGTTTIHLEPGERLVNVTWKENGNLWVLTRKADKGEPVQSYTFKESSAWGILEGTVIIVERQ